MVQTYINLSSISIALFCLPLIMLISLIPQPSMSNSLHHNISVYFYFSKSLSMKNCHPLSTNTLCWQKLLMLFRPTSRVTCGSSKWICLIALSRSSCSPLPPTFLLFKIFSAFWDFWSLSSKSWVGFKIWEGPWIGSRCGGRRRMRTNKLDCLD